MQSAAAWQQGSVPSSAQQQRPCSSTVLSRSPGHRLQRLPVLRHNERSAVLINAGGSHERARQRCLRSRDTSARAAAPRGGGGGGSGSGSASGSVSGGAPRESATATARAVHAPAAAPAKQRRAPAAPAAATEVEVAEVADAAEAAAAGARGHGRHAHSSHPRAASAAAEPAVEGGLAPLPPHQQWRWKGAKLPAAAAAAALGLAVRYGVPIPAGVDEASWSLLGFFVATVAGLVLEPVAAGAWALMCCGAAVATHALTFGEAFEAADSEVLWLIINAFFLAKAIERTGLGERVAELLVARFGGSTRSLGVSLALGEALLAPGMPSTTARAAGIFVPVIRSVAAAGGSYPDDDASRRRLGSYLVLSQLQAVAHSSTLFLTAAAQNLLCLQLAEAGGVDLGANHFLVWAQGAAVPALVGEPRRRVGGSAAEGGGRALRMAAAAAVF